MQTVHRRLDQFRVIRKHADDHRRKELAKQEPGRRHPDRPLHRQLRHLRHTRVMPGAEVIACNRLHPLVEAHYDHDEEEYDPVHNPVCADRHVAPMLFQAPVDQDHDQAGAEVHQERRHPDIEDSLYDLAPQPVNAFLKMQQLRRPGEMHQLTGQ